MHKAVAILTFISLIPVGASALTAEELTAQIEALLKEVQALQVQANSGTAQSTGAVSASGVQCPLISRNLKKGMSGADVTRLQQFLALDPSVYPEAQVTGYYGALTEAAIKRFQCKNKLVCDGTPETTGYGVTGPRTAALLALQCPDVLGGSTVSGFLKITPSAGAAPLTVNIEAILNSVKSCAATNYEIVYGDNSPSAFVSVPANTCAEMRQNFTHTYAGGGVYTVILRSGAHQVTGTVTVSGSSGGSGTPTGSTGGGSFSVTAGANGDPFAVTAAFGLSSSCARYELDWGDGSAFSSQAEGSCAVSGVTKQVSHTYQQGGSYTITLRRGAQLSSTDRIGVVITD